MTPRRILIVGGGSSGWMAAAYLDAVLNRDGKRVADIALIESPDVPRIGVGEATIPSINHILSAIGINEIEFLKRVDGTYKQAIKNLHDHKIMAGADMFAARFCGTMNQPPTRAPRKPS